MFGLKESTLKIIKNEISKYKDIDQVIIFGSRAKGNFKTGSDIDIAVKGARINDDIITRLSRKLNQESLIPHHIDIIHYEKIANHGLVDHIDRVGVPL